MTDVEALQAAIRELADRPAGLPKSCNPLIAALLRRLTSKTNLDGMLPGVAGSNEALALARAITGDQT